MTEDTKSPTLKERVKETAKATAKQLDKALDAGVQSAIMGIFSTPPELPVDWRSMLRFGGKFLKEAGRETAAVFFSKKDDTKPEDKPEDK